MMETIKSIIIMMLVMAVCVSFAGDSTPFLLDTRIGVRESKRVETLAYSSLWDGDANATVTITQDGVKLVEGLVGEGERIWNVSHNGSYKLTHTTYTNGIAGKEEIATFLVTSVVCTIMFDVGGGSLGTANATKLITEGTVIGELPMPTRTGYTFVGWWTEASGGTQISTSTTVTSNVTCYAHWSVNKYTVTFDSNGGTGGTSIKQDYGTNIIVPTVVRQGYTFKGWSPNVAMTVPASDVTYTAQWIINEYTVTFNANGGEGGTNLVFGHGTAITMPVVTRSCYDFIGWFTAVDGGNEVVCGSIVTRDMVLYAHWKRNSGTWLYEIKNGEVEIKGYTCPDGDLLIPSEIDGYTVASIGISAFSDCSALTSVAIPDSVISIGTNAFDGCNGLKDVTVSQSVCDYGMAYVFPSAYQSITNVIISDGVTNITASAFRDCKELTSIAIPDSVLRIRGSAFRDCSKLTKVTIGNGVISIGNDSFYNCSSLDEVTISDSVTSIGSSAFQLCRKLTALTIPDSVISIGKKAFNGCSGLATLIIGNGVTSIGELTFGGCSRLANVTIPQYICSSTLSSVFPSSYQTITNVVISDGVTSIGLDTFKDCSSLANVTIPDSVTSIGDSAFLNTPFYNNQPDGLVVFGKIAYKMKGISPSMVAIPDGVATICDSAFSNCNELTSVTIPDSVTNIGVSAFSDCNGLTNVTFLGRVQSLGAYAFHNCINLDTVVFAQNAPARVGGNVFNGVKLDCRAYVHRSSVGWGIDIPGNWNGLTLWYYQYNVTFDANGGNCNVLSMNVEEGTAIGALPLPTKSKAVFLGWYTATDGGIAIDTFTIVTSDMVLYAQWRAVSLEEVLNVDGNVLLETSDVTPWTLVSDSTAKVGDVSARSGTIGDRTNTWMTATVEGAGTMTFWCKTSCEHDEDGTFTWDRLMVYTNDVEIAEWRMDGETDWTERTLTFAGGANTVKWVYFKDRTGTEGEDCAWLDAVMWTPSGAAGVLPALALDAEPLAVTNAIEAAGFADVGVMAAIGGRATAYNAFKTWAGSVKVAGSGSAAAGEAAVVANTNAAVAFLLGAERLFENLPTIEIGEVSVGEKVTQGTGTQGQGTETEGIALTVSVVVKDGEMAVNCAAEKVKEMFEATSDLEDWANGGRDGARPSQLPVTVTIDDASSPSVLRFKVTPGDGTVPRAFLRVKVK